MLITRRVSEVVFGGTGSNNPVPFGMSNFALSPEDLEYVYQHVNVIVYHRNLQVNLQVTGLVRVDESGQPMVDLNDLVYLPCPPFCQSGD